MPTPWPSPPLHGKCGWLGWQVGDGCRNEGIPYIIALCLQSWNLQLWDGAIVYVLMWCVRVFDTHLLAGKTKYMHISRRAREEVVALASTIGDKQLLISKLQDQLKQKGAQSIYREVVRDVVDKGRGLETLERYALSHALNHELSNKCVASQLSTRDACVTHDACVTSHARTYSACECAAAMAMSLAVVVLCMVLLPLTLPGINSVSHDSVSDVASMHSTECAPATACIPPQGFDNLRLQLYVCVSTLRKHAEVCHQVVCDSVSCMCVHVALFLEYACMRGALTAAGAWECWQGFGASISCAPVLLYTFIRDPVSWVVAGACWSLLEAAHLARHVFMCVSRRGTCAFSKWPSSLCVCALTESQHSSDLNLSAHSFTITNAYAHSQQLGTSESKTRRSRWTVPSHCSSLVRLQSRSGDSLLRIVTTVLLQSVFDCTCFNNDISFTSCMYAREWVCTWRGQKDHTGDTLQNCTKN